jgi:DNA-binding response OmpR family regulator
MTIHAIDGFKRGAKIKSPRAKHLEEQVHHLEQLLKPTLTFPPAWGLTTRESQLLAALYAGANKPVSTERLLFAIYGGEEPEWGDACLRGFFFKLRRKLRTYEVRISNMHGTGWQLDAWSREFIRKALL